MIWQTGRLASLALGGRTAAALGNPAADALGGAARRSKRAPGHSPCHGQGPRRALDVVAIRGPLPDQPGFLAADDDLESPAPPASYRGDLLATRHTERQPGSEPRTVADLEPCRPGVV